MSPEYWSDDMHLAELFREAEHGRSWFWRINWAPILGALAMVGVSALCWWGLIAAVIYVKGW